MANKTAKRQQKLWVVAEKESRHIVGVTFSRTQARSLYVPGDKLFSVPLTTQQLKTISRNLQTL